MKIIKKGKIPPPVVYGGTCQHCGCVFDCGVEDRLTEAVVDWDWMTYRTVRQRSSYVNCPTCGRQGFICPK